MSTPAPMPIAPPRPGAPTGTAATRGHVLFRQGGLGYLLAAATLLRVDDVARLRPLADPVPGWAGTVALGDRALPVLDAASLLGQGGAPGVVLVVRAGSHAVGWGPLGLAVERLEGLRTFDQVPAGQAVARPDQAPAGSTGPRPPLTPTSGAPGISAALVTADEILLEITAEHLGRLRRAAVALSPERLPMPQSVAWSPATAVVDPARPLALRGSAHAAALPRPDEPLLVLATAMPGDAYRYLALPLHCVRLVARRGPLRPAPPSPVPLRGFLPFERFAVPTLEASALVGAPTPVEAWQAPRYAVFAALAPEGRRLALLTEGVLGVQRARGDFTPHGSGLLFGATHVGSVALILPEALSALLDVAA